MTQLCYILIQEGILATLGCARKRTVRLQADGGAARFGGDCAYAEAGGVCEGVMLSLPSYKTGMPQ